LNALQTSGYYSTLQNNNDKKLVWCTPFSYINCIRSY